MKKYLSVLLFAPVLAFAQANCLPTEAAMAVMKEKFKEHPVMVAKLENEPDRIVTVWKTQDGKAGTITLSSIKENRTCVIQSLEGVKIVGFPV